MNNQKQMPLYANMLTLDEVTKEYNHQLKLVETKSYYRPFLRVGFIDGLGYKLFVSFPESLIKKLGFEIFDIKFVNNN